MRACLRALAVFAAFCPAALVLVNAAPSPQPVEVGSQDPTINYFPPDAWAYANATNGFSKVKGAGVLMFIFQNASQAEVSWRTPDATQFFEFWAYQRSDGGNASISFDNGPEIVFDYYNQTSGGSDPPALLFSAGNLSPQQHTVRIKNLFDVRGTLNFGYGQLNVDHFVIIPVQPGATSSSTTSSATPTASSTLPTSSSIAASPSSTQSSTPTAKPGGSNNHAGAIAGGVVGGVAGLALIAAALFLFMRRGRRNGSARPLMSQNAGYPGSASDVTGTTPNSEHWNITPPPSGGVVPPPIGPLYDPNDPRTYPPPPTPAPATQSSHANTPEL